MENKITPEVLEKAKQVIGLVKAEVSVEPKEATELEKAEQDLLAAQKKVEQLKSGVAAASVKEGDTELVKAINDKFSSLGILISAKDEEIETLKKANEEIAEQLKQITAFNEEFGKKIGMIAKQPMERKSVSGSVKPVERFEKSEDSQPLSGKQVYSLSNLEQRRKLADSVLDLAIEGNEIKDQELAKACTSIELGSLGTNNDEAKRLYNKLLSKGIQVVR